MHQVCILQHHAEVINYKVHLRLFIAWIGTFHAENIEKNLSLAHTLHSPSIGIVVICYLRFGFRDPSTVCIAGQWVKCGRNTTVPASFSSETTPWWLLPSPNSMGSMWSNKLHQKRGGTLIRKDSHRRIWTYAHWAAHKYETADKCGMHTWTLPSHRLMWLVCTQTCLGHSMVNLALFPSKCRLLLLSLATENVLGQYVSLKIFLPKCERQTITTNFYQFTSCTILTSWLR